MLTPKWFLARVGPQVHLDVGLVQEGSVALGTVVHGLVIGVVAVTPVAPVPAVDRTGTRRSRAEADPSRLLTHFGPHFFAIGLDGTGASEVAQPSMQTLVGTGGHVVQRVLRRVGHGVGAVRVHEVVRRVDFDDVTGRGAPMGESVLQDGVRRWGWPTSVSWVSLL